MILNSNNQKLEVSQLDIIILPCKTLMELYKFLADFMEGELDDFLETPVSDGTIEENFEEAFGLPSLLPEAAAVYQAATSIDEFADVAQYGIVDVVGDDAYGRKVIVVSACRLPSNKVLDHNRFLRYFLRIQIFF